MLDPKDMSLTNTLAQLGLKAGEKYGQYGKVIRKAGDGTKHGEVVFRGNAGEVWTWLEATGRIVATGRVARAR